jgi:hypothetical protein
MFSDIRDNRSRDKAYGKLTKIMITAMTTIIITQGIDNDDEVRFVWQPA